MAKIVYFGFLSPNIHEGGMARNNAFYNKFRELNATVYNAYSTNFLLRIFKSIFFICYFLLVKETKIFIHQSAFLAFIPVRLYRFSCFRLGIKWLLINCVKRNQLTIEINDLPYEQAIDLKIPINNLYQCFEDLVYSIKGCHYVFASYSMLEYVKNKYNLLNSQAQVIINGGPMNTNIKFDLKCQESWLFTDKFKFVYAGSLNKGRQIEDLIAIFQNQKNGILILLGSGGDWILEIKNLKNIFYLGNYTEEEAHFITSNCDIGLIPYDAKLFYYNLCYPTKVSFYITAGIGLLCTPLGELQRIFEYTDSVVFKPIDEWESFISSLDRNQLKSLQLKTKNIQNNFTWHSLLIKLNV